MRHTTLVELEQLFASLGLKIAERIVLSPAVPGMPGDTYQSYANAIGDYNRDGFPDIVVNNYDETRSKLRNNFV